MKYVSFGECCVSYLFGIPVGDLELVKNIVIKCGLLASSS